MVLESVLAGLFITAYGCALATGIAMVVGQPLFERKSKHDLALSMRNGLALLADSKPSVVPVRRETPESVDAVHIPIKNETRIWEPEPSGLRVFHIERLVK